MAKQTFKQRRSKRAPRRIELGAVTGERAEYRVPGSIMDLLGNRNARAVCYPDTQKLLTFLQAHARRAAAKEAVSSQHAAYSRAGADKETGKGQDWAAESYARNAKRYEGRAKRAAKAGSVLEQTIADVQADLARFRLEGVTGPIPACLFRATGKKAGEERHQRRSTAMHERFHAGVRRAEHRAGVGDSTRECNDALFDVMKKEFGEDFNQVFRAGLVHRWDGGLGPKAIPEEILARVEEIRLSCKRSDADCTDVRDRLATSLRLAKVDPRALDNIADKVTRTHKGALAVVGKALKVCGRKR